MVKLKKLRWTSDEERKEMLREVESKGIRAIVYHEGEKIYPFCILCGKIIEGEHMTAIWHEPDFERNYLYSLCNECFPLLEKDGTVRRIEETVMALVASGIPRTKGELIF